MVEKRAKKVIDIFYQSLIINYIVDYMKKSLFFAIKYLVIDSFFCDVTKARIAHITF